MKPVFAFLKTTLIGGLLMLLPSWLLILLVAKAVGFIKSLAAPLVTRLPKTINFPTLIAVLLLLLVCFLTGLIMRTALGRRGADAIESHLLKRIPGYTFLRGLTHRFAGDKEEESFAVCLAAIGDTLVPALLVEEHPGEQCTVFVPSAPTPGVGVIYIIPRERVHVVDVALTHALGCVTRWGVGSGDLIEAMRETERRKGAPSPSNKQEPVKKEQ